ncbi:hypothetical protein SBA6_240008 [Candidatus Sulfopaludibacter sp. SbA6]|nr:hypothetical protein SBA6_240008 [Candidatus Sulfopaludibacter sp. SbA6]
MRSAGISAAVTNNTQPIQSCLMSYLLKV